MKSSITQVTILGDSLSDRGTLAKRHTLGFLPMNVLSGLEAKATPFGRFCNGYNWADDFALQLIALFESSATNKQTFDNQNYQGFRSLIYEESTSYADNEHQKLLDDDKKVIFKEKIVLRSFAEGGLTSHIYTNKLLAPDILHPIQTINAELARMTVSNLTQKRQHLLENDHRLQLSRHQKISSLIIEWSGANDLFTTNIEPNIAAMNHSIDARIHNVKELMKHGYRHFVLFNLPDLSLTPYYQTQKSEAARIHAKNICQQYNQKLKVELSKLQQQFNFSCQLELFDVASQFDELYQNHQHYGFDSTKMKQCYTLSADFRNRGNTASNIGFMFWDEIHISHQAHMLLSSRVYQFVSEKFDLCSSHHAETNDDHCALLLQNFYEKFDQQNHANSTAWFGIYGLFAYNTLRLNKAAEARINLDAICRHAFIEKNHHTLSILRELNWLTEENKLKNSAPKILQTMIKEICKPTVKINAL